MAFTDADVKAIAPGIPAATDISGYITAATTITDQLNDVCACSFTDAQLDQIGIWLSAHFVYMAPGASSGNIKSESIARGDYSKTMQVAKVGEGIGGTSFGQMANTLSLGCLQTFDQTQVSLHSIGSNDSNVDFN